MLKILQFSIEFQIGLIVVSSFVYLNYRSHLFQNVVKRHIHGYLNNVWKNLVYVGVLHQMETKFQDPLQEEHLNAKLLLDQPEKWTLMLIPLFQLIWVRVVTILYKQSRSNTQIYIIQKKFTNYNGFLSTFQFVNLVTLCMSVTNLCVKTKFVSLIQPPYAELILVEDVTLNLLMILILLLIVILDFQNVRKNYKKFLTLLSFHNR